MIIVDEAKEMCQIVVHEDQLSLSPHWEIGVYLVNKYSFYRIFLLNPVINEVTPPYRETYKRFETLFPNMF